jgi:hypothetical protein
VGSRIRDNARYEFGLPGDGLAKDKGSEEYRETVDDRDKDNKKCERPASRGARINISLNARTRAGKRVILLIDKTD